MKTRLSHKFFCLLLTVVMACTLLPITALADEPSGSINGAVITQNAVSVELKDVTFAESVAVKLYSGETLLTTATLKTGVLTVGQNHPFVTCCIPTEGEDDAWSLIPWTPKDDVVPDKAVLVVDGSKLAEKTFKLNADEWAALPGTVLPPSGSIESAVITHDNGTLKNAVSVELKDVTFAESVAVKLYSGETLLTTATLKTGVLTVGQNHPFVTCCIPTEGEDDAWSLIPWTPKDDVVPDKAVLVVDGHELNTKTFTLDADEWAALPGTAFPSSGSINGAVITQNAVSVELENVKFESSVQVKLYSGDTPLTTATLKPGILAAGQNYPFVTCCIPTEGEDAAWSLTPWTPKDDVVPNKAVLFVDGNKKDEKPLELNADEWAALPGTAFPYTVTYLDGFGGTYATYTNLKSGVATPVPANPYRSGYIFLGWEPSVAPTVTGDARYVAQWGYIGPQYPNPTPVQPVQPGILPPQTGDMPLWYAIARFLGLVK